MSEPVNPYAGLQGQSAAAIDRAQSVGNSTNPEAMRKLLQIGIAGAITGGGLRSLYGLYEMLRRPQEAKKSPIGLNPTVVRLKAHHRPTMSMYKESAEGGVLNWLGGGTHEDLVSKPYFLPAAAATAAGTLYGGHKVISNFLKRERKRDQKRRLEEARQLYQNALMQEYEAGEPLAGKTAAAPSELAKSLDELVRYVVKVASEKTAGGINDWAGMGTGLYLTAAGGLAGLSGLAAYNFAKGQSPGERISKAIKQRERLRWLNRPPALYFVHEDEPALKKAPLQDDEKIAKMIDDGSVAKLYL